MWGEIGQFDGKVDEETCDEQLPCLRSDACFSGLIPFIEHPILENATCDGAATLAASAPETEPPRRSRHPGRIFRREPSDRVAAVVASLDHPGVLLPRDAAKDAKLLVLRHENERPRSVTPRNAVRRPEASLPAYLAAFVANFISDHSRVQRLSR